MLTSMSLVVCGTSPPAACSINHLYVLKLAEIIYSTRCLSGTVGGVRGLSLARDSAFTRTISTPNKRPKDLIALLIIHFSARPGLHSDTCPVVYKAEEGRQGPLTIPQATERHAQRNAFHHRDCASAIQTVRPLKSMAETQPQLQPGLAEIVSDDFRAFPTIIGKRPKGTRAVDFKWS